MTEITFHTHSFDDAEFDTLLQSAMQERRNAIPAGLEQRLTARLAQAATTPATSDPVAGSTTASGPGASRLTPSWR